MAQIDTTPDDGETLPDLIDLRNMMALSKALAEAARQLGWEVSGEGFDSEKDEWRMYLQKDDGAKWIDVVFVPGS
jgi:hypothetical protein